MKIKEGFVLRNVAGEGIVIAVGKASESFHGMINMNKTSCDIWKFIDEGLTAEQIGEKLAEKYDIDVETATNDTKGLIAQLKDAGIIDE